MTITPGAARKLSRFLREHDAPLELLLFLERRKPAKALPGQSLAQKKAAKDAAHQQSMSEIRRDVMRRADGHCEHCGFTSFQLEADHFYGGIGRRRQQQSTSTVWAICRHCHKRKSANDPSRAYWAEAFAAHLTRKVIR